MTGGDQRKVPVKVCPTCGALGEYPGFLRACPACRTPQQLTLILTAGSAA